MTEIDAVRQWWLAEASGDHDRLVSATDVRSIVAGRARAARNHAVRRLWKELVAYTIPFAFSLALLTTPHSRRLLGAAIILAVYAAYAGLIWYNAAALHRIPLEGSLHESVRRMVVVLGRWMTAYLVLYVATLAGAGLAAVVLLSQHGGGAFSWAFGVAWVFVVWWSYVAGRAYVRREFGDQHDDLVQALRELEEL